MIHRILVAAVVLGLSLAMPQGAEAQSTHQMRFAFSGSDGSAPYAGLVQGRDGLFYGTTAFGGPDGKGTIFRIAADGTGFQTLHVFTGIGTDGAVPMYGALVQDGAGFLYGTTTLGGTSGVASNMGTLFKLDVSVSPPVVTTLFSFDARAANPSAGVMIGTDGFLYGTTERGGTSDLGTVFKIGLDGNGFVVLHDFSGPDGARPLACVIEASDGFLYGTTQNGGLDASGPVNSGTVFKVGKDGLDFGTLHMFGASEGLPVAGVIEGADGRLYGATPRGGNATTPAGIVFALDKSGAGFQTLHSFDLTDAGGGEPWGGLLQGRDGNLYGTTSLGTNCPPEGCGSVFMLTPGGAFTTLHAFSLIEGAFPTGRLLQGSDGSFYGTTVGGNAIGQTTNPHGTVFVLATAQIELAGPAFADDLGSAAYSIGLRNASGVDMPGPFSVAISVSPGLLLSSESSDPSWVCTGAAPGPFDCAWASASGLPAGVFTGMHTLTFAVGPAPFAPVTACGVGPAPCVVVQTSLSPFSSPVAFVTGVRTLTGGLANSFPEAGDDAAMVNTNPVTIDVLYNDRDPDGDTLSVTVIATLPSAGDAVINPNGTITYTPWGGHLTGTDFFRYRVADTKGASVTALVSINPPLPTLTPSRSRLNIGPVAAGRFAAEAVWVRGMVGLKYSVRFENLGPTDDIPTLLAGTAHNTTLAVSDPEAFRVQPSPNDTDCFFQGTRDCWTLVYFRPSLTPGVVSVARAVLTAYVYDDFDNTTPKATTSMVVVGSSANPPSSAPVTANDDAAATPVDTPVQIDVLANDRQTNMNFISMTGVWAFSNLEKWVFDRALDVSANGFISSGGNPITFTPQSGFTGTTRFTYSASGACASACQSDDESYYFATVTVTVGDPRPVVLTVVKPGGGSGAVTSAPAGIDCGTSCSASYNAGTVVTLTATPDASSTFTGWSGVCSGTSTCIVTMSAATNVTATFTSMARADVGVTVGANPATAVVGEPVTLTAVVTNDGPDGATNVQFTGLDYVASVSSAISASTTHGVCQVPGDTGYLGTSVSCNLGTLGTQVSDKTATITVIATLTSAAAPLPNGNSVNMNSDVSASELDIPVTNNHFRGAFGARQRQADVGVTVAASPNPAFAGEPVTLTAVITNNGPDAATNVQFSGLDYVASVSSAISASTTHGACQVPGDTGYLGTSVSCNLGTLGTQVSDKTATITVIATLTSAAAPLPNGNSVNVNSDVSASELDTIAANNHFGGGFGANQRQADVAVTVAASPTTVNVGQPVTITATVTNNGPDAATNVALSLPIPGISLLTGISVMSSQGTCSPIVAGATDPIACTLGTLAQNASATMTIVATPTSALVSPGLNSSTVTIPAVVSATEFDPATTNNHFSNGFTVILPFGQFTDTGTGVSLPFNTPQGIVTVTFSSVTQPGFTNVTTTLIAPPLPVGFNLNGAFYDITTTALYTPPITVCFTGSFAAGDHIKHYEAGAWVTPTPQQSLPLSGPPFTTICAQTASLSPFAVVSPVNHAPIANAGPNQTVEATSPTGAVVTLNGSGSDPDGDTLSFSWSGPCGPASSAVATLTCPIGVNSMTLTVSDGRGGVASGVVLITVQETKPPTTEARICTTLGGKKLPDVDLFYFRGIKGETVTLRLDPNPSGTYTDGGAALLLFGSGLLKSDTSNLPNVVTAALPKTDTYFVTVSELLLKQGKFSGAYCLSLESSQNAWQTFTQK